MAGHVCHVVPPYILHDIASGSDAAASRHATQTLQFMRHIHQNRERFFRDKLAHGQHAGHLAATHNVVPDYVLEHITSAPGVNEATRQNAADTLATNQRIRAERIAGMKEAIATPAVVATAVPFTRSVYDMRTSKDDAQLPGHPARAESQKPVADKAVNEVYDNCLKVLQFFRTIFQYDSLNGQNMPVVSSVHYGVQYQNASWYGDQMIYGDGADPLFNFTTCLDVMGHEMTHAITQYNSSLQYEDESGALNEHLSDVFGIMVKQWAEQKAVKDCDWLIGEGCFMPDKKGVALRNMKNPGTAYKNFRGLGGTDPQPAHVDGMKAYIASGRLDSWVERDHGGVHVFSGIPNRAFVICAEAFGGFSWEKAGKIWWTTATTHRIAPKCTFLQFANVTVAVAQELYGNADAQKVRDAWNTVGVKGI